MILAERLAHLQHEITVAKNQLGRPQHSITLLAVSKGQPFEKVKAALKLGLRRFGENYLQEALPKIKAFAPLKPEWHFIGRIQSNKTRDIATHFDWVHSVCDAAIARRLNEHCAEQQRSLNICIQVNIGSEASKAGVSPAAVLSLAEYIATLSHLTLRGLMTIPVPTKDFDLQRANYNVLYATQQQLIRAGFSLDTLSMGMSQDFKAAIAAGSTLIRVGTALFGPRQNRTP